MKKLFLFLVFSVVLFSKTIDATYDVEYGIFGKLGESQAKIVVDEENKYSIYITASTTGLAKHLSSNMQEKYESHGVFINDRYQPFSFTKITSKNEKIKIKEFSFDYLQKKITLTKTTKKKENGIWKEYKEKQVLDFWTNEDILTLFFNLKHYIPDTTKEIHKTLVAIGAGLSKKGQIDVTIPASIQKEQIKNELKKPNSNKILIVKIYNKLFNSEQGELYISLNEDGICDKSLLKDVLLFGDIRGILR